MVNSDQLDKLKRRNAGHRILPALRESLASVFEISPETLNFLSLEESDSVRGRVSQSFPPRHGIERNDNYPFVVRTLPSPLPDRQLFPQVGSNDDLYVILPEADRVGVLRLPLSVMNRKWRALLGSKTDGFIVVDAAFSNKMVFQQEQDVGVGQMVIDLAAWGEKWSEAVRAFGP